MDPSKIFDGLLLLQYRSGKKKALSLLVNKYHNKLCKHSYWCTYDIDDSKDIVQDCWSTVINNIDKLKEPNLFGSWVFRIVTRKSLDFVRKQKRDLGKLKQFGLTDKVSENKGDKEQVIQKLFNAIQTLPKEKQMILRLFYIEQYSLKEISSILNVSEGTVKSRLFHSREKSDEKPLIEPAGRFISVKSGMKLKCYGKRRKNRRLNKRSFE